MKKIYTARIFVFFLVISSFMGGSFALKIKDPTLVIYTHATTDPVTTRCTVPLTGITTLPGAFPTYICATTKSTLPCVCKTWYLTN